MRYIKAITVLFLCVALFTACGVSNRPEVSPGGSEITFRIVTSFYPMYVFTLNLTRDIKGVQVTNMTEPQTGCLHDYELSPADMKTLEKADIFIINGAGMEAFIGDIKNSYPNLPIVEAAKDIPLITDESTGVANPHVWVSISNAVIEVKNIGQALATSDLNHADQYKANMDTYVSELETERTKMHDALKDIADRDIVTFHEAFPYFAREFGLNIVSVIEREPGTEPSAGELARTIDTIKTLKVKAIFAEPQYSPKAADTIATETGVKVYSLDPFVTGPKDASPDSYIKVMDQNLNTLKEALM